MADDRRIEMTGSFDDDRLQAFALGFDDDPQLVAAAAADEGLRRRLDAVRAEVEQVGAQVRAAVPYPDDDYTDLSDPRWAGLGELLAPPQPAGSRSRASRWLRVLAPAAVAVVAVAVGLTVIYGQKSGSVAVNSSVPAAAKASGEAAGPLTGAGATDRAGDYAQALSEQLDRYALVVLAKAKAASGAFQRFVVVKFLKGDGPHVVRLRVADQPANTGRLQVLFLRPMMGESAETGPEPAPIPSAAETTSTLESLVIGVPVMYSYDGEAAMARELPAGTDPAAVELP